MQQEKLRFRKFPCRFSFGSVQKVSRVITSLQMKKRNRAAIRLKKMTNVRTVAKRKILIPASILQTAVTKSEAEFCLLSVYCLFFPDEI